ncbi:hypothetical protein HYALB_00004811 [Hymenoscyphus albidus]|uniref:DUF8021 domain-containing protein n=1 Tax=Hymenoscyphus albidus TaxID=595503 RepID=A0A9N9LM05_9HELO|nr:hypothetical protein HYALB_00004811 [Hymenoscyphus albidus]
MTTLSNTVSYIQNDVSIPITAGVLATPIAIDHNRSTLDTTQCATYTEIVSTEARHPYVIGTQIRFSVLGNGNGNGNGSVSALGIEKVETVVTEKGDWLFDPVGTLKYVRLEEEKWGRIPPSKLDTRATIQAAADAYLDLFNDKSVQVPWGTPCARLEGGSYTGKGSASDSCNVGVPSGVKITNRRYVVDEILGAVDVMCTFASSADTHEFRVEGGRLRFVHTMTDTGR